MTNNVSNIDRHIAVFPFPFGSHSGTLFRLVRRLATDAPTVTFSFFSTPKTIESLFSPSKNIPHNIKPYVVSDGVPEGHAFSGNPEEPISLYLAAVEEGEGLKGVLKAAEAEIGQRIGCVMSDAFLWFAGDLAGEMVVPWVPFMVGGAGTNVDNLFRPKTWIGEDPSPVIYMFIFEQTANGRIKILFLGVPKSKRYIIGRENDVVKFIPGFSELRLGDLPMGVLFGNLESPFAIMLHKMGRALPKATAVVINSFEKINQEINQDLKPKFEMFLNVSPFDSISWSSSSAPPSLDSDKYGCIPWLDNHAAASVAYISFGTSATPPPIEIVALAEALEVSGTPFLWSLKDNFKELLPEAFMERASELGKIVPWAPQEQVLAHGSVGVFVTHCGWNSVLESIVAGVPLIGRPFFGDHHLNTWMVTNVWKIGVSLEGGVFTKTGTMSALELVLSHEKGRELREQIGNFKELALKAAGPEGSSTHNLNTLLEVVTKYNLQKC
ncbi:hypothetical protein RHMOL_Rhmol09G0210100 [Rhododendron molle]|uniref:Uncharacterized protein n=1 Tax=Rhododendron molle TaxID=49168 RepID=A0ACC0MHJ9_RHOML|nr:hypothetical protein RHMOL_Rhmol09G0210100 [Rhododendron molle]